MQDNIKPTQQGKVANLATFFCLYLAQTLPMSFFSTVIPVMMRQDHYSLSAIGLLQLIKLPWILKFIWSPLIDRKIYSMKEFKRCIILSELIYAVLIFTVAFLDFKTDFYTIIFLILLSFIASATQDIATDALAVLSFSHKDKSMVNSMQSMGSFGGAMLGGGLLLILFHHFGWNLMLPFVAILVVAAILPLCMNKNIQLIKDNADSKASFRDLALFFTQRRISRHITFLMLYYAGVMGTLAMIKPLLVDLGYDMESIGLMNGVFGTAVAFCSSFAGGVIIRNMGRRKSTLLFSLTLFLATSYLVVLSMVPAPPLAGVYGGIAILWSSYGLAMVVVFTLAMDKVRLGKEGTDFTLQIVLTHVASMIVAISCGRIADIAGYTGMLLFESLLAVISIIYVTFFYKKEIADEHDQ